LEDQTRDGLVKVGKIFRLTDQEEVEYPLACQESSNSGSKNNFLTGTSEAFEDDEVANEGTKRNIFIHGPQHKHKISAQGNNTVISN